MHQHFDFEKNHLNISFSFLVLLAGIILCAIFRSAVIYGFFLISSKKIHEKMLNSILHTTVRFFDLNPTGRIMNRFSKDVNNIDEILPITLFDLLQVLKNCLVFIQPVIVLSFIYVS